MSLLVIGDIMFDIVARIDGPPFAGSDHRAKISFLLGGSGANQSIWASHLGVPSKFCGCVHADDYETIIDQFVEYGVNATLQQVASHSGRVVCIVSDDGERSFITDRGANDLLQLKFLSILLMNDVDHVHISGHLLYQEHIYHDIIDFIAKCKSKNIMISMDIGSASFVRDVGANRFNVIAESCDFLFANNDELKAISNDNIIKNEGQHQHSCHGIIILKNGADGACCVDSYNNIIAESNGVEVSVVDSTGAGDAFFAGFISAYRKTKDMTIALTEGVKMGALCCTMVGARPGSAELMLGFIRCINHYTNDN